MTAAQRRPILWTMLLVLGAAGLLACWPMARRRAQTEIDTMAPGKVKRVAAASLALMGLTGTGQGQGTARPLPPAPPTTIGMNLPQISPTAGFVPFANLAIGSLWYDSKYKPIGAHQDKDGTLLSMPPEGYAQRVVSIPLTGPAGIEVRCTYEGSGVFTLFGAGEPLPSGKNLFRFHIVNQHDPQAHPWILAHQVDPARPLHDLDCREAGVPRAQRFRPAFLATLRGYRVLRFMDWQNANNNQAVHWADRHTPASLNVDVDGVSIEDMLALARELDADAWFVMPWNADDDYIIRFARLTLAQLPAGHRVYVEVGNEVWNAGFPVGRQAVVEGEARGLGKGIEAGMHRYAQRTSEVMRLWEAVFAGADRHRLVRVLATQHVWTDTATMALTFGDTATHIDALATAPYFGETLGGVGYTRDNVVAKLQASLPVVMQQALANRRIAVAFGKRYIAYEGGEGLALPAQPQLLGQMQNDPVQYALYTQYLTTWRRELGDTLCLLTSVSPPGTSGAWGLTAWEDETPAEAPKLRAVRDAMAAR